MYWGLVIKTIKHIGLYALIAFLSSCASPRFFLHSVSHPLPWQKDHIRAFNNNSCPYYYQFAKFRPCPTSSVLFTHEYVFHDFTSHNKHSFSEVVK